MYIRTETDMEQELVKTMQSIEAKQNKAEVLNFARTLLIGERNIKQQYGMDKEPPQDAA